MTTQIQKNSRISLLSTLNITDGRMIQGQPPQPHGLEDMEVRDPLMTCFSQYIFPLTTLPPHPMQAIIASSYFYAMSSYLKQPPKYRSH